MVLPGNSCDLTVCHIPVHFQILNIFHPPFTPTLYPNSLYTKDKNLFKMVIFISAATELPTIANVNFASEKSQCCYSSLMSR